MAQEEKRRRKRKSVDPHIVNALGQYSGFQFLTARNWCVLWKMDAAYWFLVVTTLQWQRHVIQKVGRVLLLTLYEGLASKCHKFLWPNS
jgi:hypothetical protein